MLRHVSNDSRDKSFFKPFHLGFIFCFNIFTGQPLSQEERKYMDPVDSRFPLGA